MTSTDLVTVARTLALSFVLLLALTVVTGSRRRRVATDSRRQRRERPSATPHRHLLAGRVVEPADLPRSDDTDDPDTVLATLKTVTRRALLAGRHDPLRTAIVLRGDVDRARSIAWRLAATCHVSLLHLHAQDLVNGITGDSQRIINSVVRTALVLQPGVVLIEHLDHIGADARTAGARRAAHDLTTSLRRLDRDAALVIVATTQRPLDAGLMAPDVFDTELLVHATVPAPRSMAA